LIAINKTPRSWLSPNPILGNAHKWRTCRRSRKLFPRGFGRRPRF